MNVSLRQRRFYQYVHYTITGILFNQSLAISLNLPCAFLCAAFADCPADLVFAPTPACKNCAEINLSLEQFLYLILSEDLLLNYAMITTALRISLRGTFCP